MSCSVGILNAWDLNRPRNFLTLASHLLIFGLVEDFEPAEDADVVEDLELVDDLESVGDLEPVEDVGLGDDFDTHEDVELVEVFEPVEGGNRELGLVEQEILKGRIGNESLI